MKKEFIEALEELLNAPQKIIIIPHKNPDGDALGSALALSRFLRKKSHEIRIISPNEYPTFFDWLPGQKEILKYNQDKKKAQQYFHEATIIFTLDFNDLSRIEEMEDDVHNTKVPIVMIDHHEAPKNYAQLVYSDTSMSSTCEMVFNVLCALDKNAIDTDIANCLYTGIMTDTGSFRFPSTTAATHQAAAFLIDRGAQGTMIQQNIYDTYSFDRLKLLGITINNMKKVDGLPVVYITLIQEELNRHNFKRGDTEGFVNFGLRLMGIRLSVIMIENREEGKIKMSFRSKGNFSVNEFARTHFDGGGHLNAAGGKSTQSMDKTVTHFLTALKSYNF